VRVLVAVDGAGFAGPWRVARAIGDGWERARPGDEVRLHPLSDGGPGLLDAVEAAGDSRVEVEVAGPLGHPVDAAVLVRPDGTAVVEAAMACGAGAAPEGNLDPLAATTYGVGQLLAAARDTGARRVLVGDAGCVAPDGGAGALMGLGFRITVEDGSGVKIGAGELSRVAAVERGWSASWDDVEVVVLAGGTRPGAAPQAGSDATAATLARGHRRWARVASRDLRPNDAASAGEPGGVAFGLALALGAAVVSGPAAVAELVGLEDAIAAVDLVVAVDPDDGPPSPVAGHVRDLAAAAATPAVMLQLASADLGEVDAGGGARVADAAAALASRVG
jgi:glycerate 2-kinase